MINGNGEIVVSTPLRTAIGTFGGALKDTLATDLGATVGKEAGEAEPQVGLLKDVQETRHRPAAGHVGPEGVEVRRLELPGEGRETDAALAALPYLQARVARVPAIEAF